MNAKAQHTPGNWVFSREIEKHPYGEALGYRIRGEHGIVVAEIFPKPHLVAVELANARLIATAPELLTAITDAERFVAGFEDDDMQEGVNELLSIMRNAIAKATGGAS